MRQRRIDLLWRVNATSSGVDGRLVTSRPPKRMSSARSSAVGGRRATGVPVASQFSGAGGGEQAPARPQWAEGNHTLSQFDRDVHHLPCGGFFLGDDGQGRAWCPAFLGRLGPTIREIHRVSGCTRIVFTAVLDPAGLLEHLRGVRAVWSEPTPLGPSPCIEIEYDPDHKLKETIQ